MKRERGSCPPIAPSLLFLLKLSSYIPPPSSAYHKARGLWNNLYQILQATPKSGGCGSSGFPAYGTSLPHTFFYFGKHQVHSGGEGCFVLITLHYMESIFHQTPHYVPVLLLGDIALEPELQHVF